MTAPEDQTPAVPSALHSLRCAKLLEAANAEAQFSEDVVNLVIEQRLMTDRATHFPELDSLMRRLAAKEQP